MNKLLLITLLLLLAGCYTQTHTTQTPLLNTSYQVEWIGEYPLIDNSYLNITLNQDNKAYGLAGCNYWSANYQQNTNQIKFTTPFRLTKKNCSPALMEQETRFIKALMTVEHWSFSETGQLHLWTTDKQAIKLWLERNSTDENNQ